MIAYLTHDQREQVKALAAKYEFPAKKLLQEVSDKMLEGDMSFRTILNGYRMAFAEMNNTEEFFTPEDVAEATGESIEAVNAAAEEMIAEAIANGEDPNDYIRVINNDANPFKHEYDYVTKIVDGKEEMCFSARGIFKLTYFTIADNDGSENARTIEICTEFMNTMFRLCAMRGYGKTFSEIKSEVATMDKDNVTDWIEAVYDKYVFQNDVFETLERIKAN